MRISQRFGRTLREIPADAEIPSHQLLLRAGMIRRLVAGMYSFLPLGQRAIRKLEGIIRDELDAIGGQEIDIPLIQPADLWQESGRWDALVGKEMVGFEDRFGRPLVLAISHEEAVTELARSQISSYRQLPVMLYQIKPVFRDEARPRSGLIRLREFPMMDAYSFHTDEADLEGYYNRVHRSYQKLFERVGLDVVAVESAHGLINGAAAHQFMLITDSGEDSAVFCDGCKYTANIDVAVMQKPKVDNGAPQPIEEVATPEQRTIEGVATYLGIPKTQTLKAVFYSTDENLIFVVLRGDLEVNESKLMKIVGVSNIWIASEAELQRYGLVAGYASPIGVKDVQVVVDDSVVSTTNLVGGANKAGYHLKNLNFPRDFKADIVDDIALVQEDSACVHCGGTLRVKYGITVGNLCKLGTQYSQAMGATYQDEKSKGKPIFMGSYSIEIPRLLASIVEANHDKDGIVWPPAVAPYQLHLMHIGKDEDVIERADALYQRLQQEGYDVLYDDRSGSAGFKFKEADLLGMPVRITVSQRTLEADSVEVKLRSELERRIVRLDTLGDGELSVMLKESVQ